MRLLAILVTTATCTIAVADNHPPESLTLMTQAAESFVDSLTEEQRERALFSMDDVDEREHFRPAPFPITALRFDKMTLGQRALVHAMLNAGLSASGYHKVSSIIALEEYLVELENADGRAPVFHGNENYTVAIFDDPEPGGTWAWRLHGHHLFLSFTVVDGALVATAPAFLGAEPHHVTEGPRAGWRILAAEEDLGRALAESLSDAQLATATIGDEAPRDMFSGNARKVDPMDPEGIAFGALDDSQQATLKRLVSEYVNNGPADLRAERNAKIEGGGWDAIHFAWIGDPTGDTRIYYRVQGPEFLIEYSEVALSSNHVHTIWRDFNGDFGRDLLAEHHQAHH